MPVPSTDVRRLRDESESYGSTVVEDLETGQLLILLHDCTGDDPFEELVGSFDELILEQINMVIHFEE